MGTRHRPLPTDAKKLLRRVDRLYLDLAHIYVRIGKVLGLRPCACQSDLASRKALNEDRRGVKK